MSVKFPSIEALVEIVEDLVDLIQIDQEPGKPAVRHGACVYVTVYADEDGNYDHYYSKSNPRYLPEDKRPSASPRYKDYKHSCTMAYFGGGPNEIELVAEGLLQGLYRCKEEMDAQEAKQNLIEEPPWGHTPGGYYDVESARPRSDDGHGGRIESYIEPAEEDALYKRRNNPNSNYGGEDEQSEMERLRGIFQTRDGETLLSGIILKTR
jgi:hypothetical protein